MREHNSVSIIEHIPAYSPQARGRRERLNRPFQDRLVNELRVAQITTLAAANGYLRDRFLPVYNATFSCPPHDPASAVVPVGRVDLDQILCHEEQRLVGGDNTVAFQNRAFQLARQPGRRSCAGLPVVIRRPLSGEYSIWPWDASALPLPGRTRAPARSANRHPACGSCRCRGRQERAHHLGKRTDRVFHSYHRRPSKAVRSLVKRKWTDHLSTTPIARCSSIRSTRCRSVHRARRKSRSSAPPAVTCASRRSPSPEWPTSSSATRAKTDPARRH